MGFTGWTWTRYVLIWNAYARCDVERGPSLSVSGFARRSTCTSNGSRRLPLTQHYALLCSLLIARWVNSTRMYTYLIYKSFAHYLMTDTLRAWTCSQNETASWVHDTHMFTLWVCELSWCAFRTCNSMKVWNFSIFKTKLKSFIPPDAHVDVPSATSSSRATHSKRRSLSTRTRTGDLLLLILF